MGYPSLGPGRWARRVDRARRGPAARWRQGGLPSASAEGHADIGLREGGRCRHCAGDELELGELTLLVELAGIGEGVEHGGHPPGEVLCPPDPVERGGGVALQQRGRAISEEGAQRAV